MIGVAGALLATTSAQAEITEPAVADAAASAPHCTDGVCTIKITAPQLLAKAEYLVAQKRYDDAAPLIAALVNAPQYDLERRFLSGFVAVEMGDLNTAIKEFRAILASDPHQTRVRLELARALMLKGKNGSADYHFRLAAQDDTLPADIVATIRTARGVLRSQRKWNFNLDFGVAPDSNINNGTAAQSIDVAFGTQTVPLTLDPSARKKSGTGQTASVAGGVRLTLADKLSLLIDADGQVINYAGTAFDDIGVQAAIGPELRLSDKTSISVQALGAHRWYGGKRATLAGGIKAGVEHTISNKERIGLQFDGRRTDSGFSRLYSGWQFGAYATYERVVSKSMIASASLFARRDSLNDAASSSYEVGANIGIGGELPHGITAGISAGASRAVYDAPVRLFSDDPRHDWRFNARVNVGLRSIRVLGFSPSVTYTFAKNDSSLALYKSDRHRVRFTLARYF
jgi:outer membrane protein